MAQLSNERHPTSASSGIVASCSPPSSVICSDLASLVSFHHLQSRPIRCCFCMRRSWPISDCPLLEIPAVGNIVLVTRDGRMGAAFKVNEEHCPAARTMARMEINFLIAMSMQARRGSAPSPRVAKNAGNLKSQHFQGGEERWRTLTMDSTTIRISRMMRRAGREARVAEGTGTSLRMCAFHPWKAEAPFAPKISHPTMVHKSPCPALNRSFVRFCSSSSPP
jgi:hypothetical protein